MILHSLFRAKVTEKRKEMTPFYEYTSVYHWLPNCNSSTYFPLWKIEYNYRRLSGLLGSAFWSTWTLSIVFGCYCLLLSSPGNTCFWSWCSLTIKEIISIRHQSDSLLWWFLTISPPNYPVLDSMYYLGGKGMVIVQK